MKAHWDPKPDERTYYRSTGDGQRGYLVRREGKDCIRLDRPMEELIRPLDGMWQKDAEVYPVSPHQAAKIAFVADCALCSVIGEHVAAKREWLNMSEKKRIEFMQEGPGDDSVRDELFFAITGVLRKMTDG